MTLRDRVAVCVGAAAVVMIATAGVTHVHLIQLAGRTAAEIGENARQADRLVLSGAGVGLLLLAAAGLFLWRACGALETQSAAGMAPRPGASDRELMLDSINANLDGTCVYRMVYHRDGSMVCTYASPNIERLIGLPSAQFVADATTVFALVHPDDLPEFRAAIARALATGENASITVRVRHPNGGLLWLQFRSRLAERRPDGAQVRDGVVVDITSVLHAKTELRSVRDRLELALRSSRTCIWEYYVSEKRILLDATWAAMRGFPPEPTVTTAGELIQTAHPDDRARLLTRMVQAHRGKTDEYECEHRVSTADGGWAWVLSLGRVTARDREGRALRMFGTNTDITSRRQAEQRGRDLNANLERLVAERTAELVAATDRLATSEQHCRNLVESINQGFYVADRRSLFTYCNPAVAAVAGTSGRELLGTSVFRLVAKEDRARVIATYQDWAGSTVREGTIEFRVPSAAGRLINVEQSTMIIRGADGGVLEYRNILRDVTERKAAEARLRQSNDRFRAVFDHSPIIIGLLTVPEGRLVEFNAAGVETFGYTREEALGRTTLELGLWADPAERTSYLTELLAKGQVTSFEAKMRRKNGEIFYVAYTGSIISIDGQRYSLNSLLDITAQRRSEARLAYALEATNDGVWDWNVKTGEAYFSPQWARLLGFAPDEVTQRVEMFYSLLHPDDVTAIQRPLADHFGGLTPIKEIEVRLRTKAGDYRWFLDRGKVVVRDADGAPERMVGTITDITERKNAERMRTMMQFSIDRASDGIFWLGPDARLLYANEAAVQRLGFSREELLAMRLFDFELDLSPEQWPEHWSELKRQGSLVVYGRHRAKCGTIIPVEIYANHVSFDGLEFNFAFARDITARRLAEQEREQMQASLRATQKMEAMGTLAGGIAHDFNNILTGVINYSMLAREECPPGHPRFVKYVEAVLACGHRAKDLVRQILLFSRAEDGPQEPTRLQDVVREALALLRSTLPATATIEVQMDEAAPLMLASPTQLHQIVMNLGINAVQSLPNKTGRISVRLDACVIDPVDAGRLPELTPGPHLRLEVTDDGCGMDETVQARIFDPFFTTKRAGEGTGLGLAVVHGIVRGHRGAIAVRSQPGEGATFEIFFPVHQLKAASKGRALTAQSAGRGERLLLVDDEQIVLETMKILLERLGYRVTEQLRPAEALARFEAEPDEFDALVTDYMMPGLTGIQLAEKIAARRSGLPVVLISGFFARHTAEELARLNIKALVPKPIELGELSAALARAFGR